MTRGTEPGNLFEPYPHDHDAPEVLERDPDNRYQEGQIADQCPYEFWHGSSVFE